jgi:hypothetical protein
MNYEDVCTEAGVDPSYCDDDMRAVITYMAENAVTLDGIPQSIKDQVHAWVWNHSIFDIYDEIRGEPNPEIDSLLSYALQLFNDNEYIVRQIKDLALHLGVNHISEKEENK